ncbi:hypothetical protein MKQ68_25365 [Chitinophaga horti]|uniref:YtxH-like protein n=1 Tax=Chitinophaga horti TaxID=2920382 RepID=A0ABY6J1M3_9BACT|nr:hypothetical protein [Chitinophaga horti]UYQ93415.1 hypothetical protein MKQ68_25365 [Chitinophaga horti]
MKTSLLILTVLLITGTAEAQFLKKLKSKVTSTVERKINNTIDRTISKTTDKVVDSTSHKIERMATDIGKNKKRRNQSAPEPEAPLAADSTIRTEPE